MKKWLYPIFLPILAIVVVFSSSGVVQAAPFASGKWFGYFHNIEERSGADLFPGGIYTTNVQSFIDTYYLKLLDPNPQAHKSAAFTILTMLGAPARTPWEVAKDRFDEWQNIVRWYDANGRISWAYNFPYVFNTYYQRGAQDVAWYEEPDTRDSIVFWNDNGSSYAIKKDCANPVGDMSPVYIPTPPPNHNLFPVISSTPASTAAIPETVTFVFSIRNDGTTGVDGGYVVSVRNNSSALIPYNGGPGESMAGVRVEAGQVVTLPVTFSQASNTSWGGRICAYMIVTNANPAGEQRSTQKCVDIGKKPLFQAQGGDIWAGGAIAPASGVPCGLANTSRPGNITGASSGGSFGEYGVFALGRVGNFGSGATPHVAANSSRLTFSNTSSSNLGFYHGSPPSSGRCLTHLAQYAAAPSALGTTNVNLTTQANGVYSSTDNLQVSGVNISGGKRIVISTTGNITITGQGITYQNTGYARPDQLPLVILIAGGNITVNNSVTQVDGWLSTNNRLLTCETSGPLASGNCNQQLRFNGPVIAREVIMRRTFGNTNSGQYEPAEIFNLRPDVLLRAQSENSSQIQVRTIKQQELPARY